MQLLNATSLYEETEESEQLSAAFPGGKLARHVHCGADGQCSHMLVA